MAQIEVEGLYKIFGRHACSRALEMSRDGASRDDIQQETGCVVAVRDATFTVHDAEIFVIMGLSGSGKSTLLRCVNRLIEPTAGRVSIDDTDVLELETEDLLELRKHRTSMVFQNFGLLDHRTVLENAAFALELQNIPKKEREEKARESLALVGLEGNEDYKVTELSGGMQQRVGLARALATDADVLLMDEAFSALDPLIRTRMQMEFLELQKKYPKTILFITHDLSEALSMGDRIAIMKDGAIVQIGGPEEIITNPANDYVASFVENVDRSRVVTVGTAMEEWALEEADLLGVTATPREALERMDRRGKHYVFVGDEQGVSGFVHRAEAGEARESESVEHIVQETPEAISVNERLIRVMRRVASAKAPIPVKDEEGEVVGRIDKEMILEAVAGGRGGDEDRNEGAS